MPGCAPCSKRTSRSTRTSKPKLKAMKKPKKSTAARKKITRKSSVNCKTSSCDLFSPCGSGKPPKIRKRSAKKNQGSCSNGRCCYSSDSDSDPDSDCSCSDCDSSSYSSDSSSSDSDDECPSCPRRSRCRR